MGITFKIQLACNVALGVQLVLDQERKIAQDALLVITWMWLLMVLFKLPWTLEQLAPQIAHKIQQDITPILLQGRIHLTLVWLSLHSLVTIGQSHQNPSAICAMLSAQDALTIQSMTAHPALMGTTWMTPLVKNAMRLVLLAMGRGVINARGATFWASIDGLVTIEILMQLIIHVFRSASKQILAFHNLRII